MAQDRYVGSYGSHGGPPARVEPSEDEKTIEILNAILLV